MGSHRVECKPDLRCYPIYFLEIGRIVEHLCGWIGGVLNSQAREYKGPF